MASWKNNVGKYFVTRANEIEDEILWLASMSNRYSYGVFKILPYKEDYFPEVDYKVELEPIEIHKYLKRPWYICDLESRMSNTWATENDKSAIISDLDQAIEYAFKLNELEKEK